MLATARSESGRWTTISRLAVARRPHLWTLLFLAALGLALRCWRLDLISFRFDNAELLFRTRQTLELGYPPLTGIVNSLGFHNPPGIIWLLLPPLVLSPSPQIATAWFALLSLSALWPLYRLARLSLPSKGYVLACTLFVALPSSIMMGRSVWQQNILPTLGAFALLWLLEALDATRPAKARGLAASGCLLVLLFGASVHLAAFAWLLLALAFLAPLAWKGAFPSQTLRFALFATTALALTFVPSALDAVNVRMHPPQEKPDYIATYERKAPDASSPLPARLGQAMNGPYAVFANQSTPGGIEADMPGGVQNATRALDTLFFVLALAGTALVLFKAASTSQGPERLRARVILAWVFVPCLAGALVMPRINATYFFLAVPGALLLCAYAPQALLERLRATPRARHVAALALSALPLAVYGWFFMSAMATIDRTGFANGVYYIPLRDQAQVAQRLAGEGIARGQLYHVSGEWFQRPYDYLHQEVYRAPAASLVSGQWAILYDQCLYPDHPKRSDFFLSHAAFRHANVAAALLPAPDAVRACLDQLWSVQEEKGPGRL